LLSGQGRGSGALLDQDPTPLCRARRVLASHLCAGLSTPNASSASEIRTFIHTVSAMPEGLEFRRLAGEIDFFLRLVTVDMKHYERTRKTSAAR
jgi:DNA-binding Lrp family transcriptional regulator